MQDKQANQTTCFIARPTVTDPRLTEARKALLGHLRPLEDESLSAEICFDLYSLSLRALPRDCVLIVWNLCHITLEVLLRTLAEFIFSLSDTYYAWSLTSGCQRIPHRTGVLRQ